MGAVLEPPRHRVQPLPHFGDPVPSPWLAESLVGGLSRLGQLTEVQEDEFGEQDGEEADEEGHGEVDEEQAQEEGAQPGTPGQPAPARKAACQHIAPIPRHLGHSGAESPFPTPIVMVGYSSFSLAKV